MDTINYVRLACPGCGQDVGRTHRTWLDRLRTFFAPKARYQCSAGCGWDGLLAPAERKVERSKVRRISYRGRRAL